MGGGVEGVEEGVVTGVDTGVTTWGSHSQGPSISLQSVSLLVHSDSDLHFEIVSDDSVDGSIVRTREVGVVPE